jgi:hypothetical protein
MTLVDRCYCRSRDKRAVVDSTHNSDGSYDISKPLLLWGHVTRVRVLLASTVATDHLTSADHCYYHQQ